MHEANRPFTSAVAMALGVDEAAVRTRVMYLRKENLFCKGSGGRPMPDPTPTDATNLLLAFLGGGNAQDAARTVRQMRQGLPYNTWPCQDEDAPAKSIQVSSDSPTYRTQPWAPCWTRCSPTWCRRGSCPIEPRRWATLMPSFPYDIGDVTHCDLEVHSSWMGRHVEFSVLNASKSG